MTTNKPRGRPRRFDPDAAVAIAQQLFHARGYDRVSVADLTEALGINPPSFYAAFGSKAGLYQRSLERWADTGAIPIADILRPDRPVAEALAALLDEAARRYAADPEAPGCLVLEGTRCNEESAREAALGFNRAAETLIHDYVAARHPEAAARVTDFVSTTMSGLSAKARHGQSLERLRATAEIAGLALRQALAD
ncbi:TetR/AcrR family transcriptional regulator [Sphingosinicella sp. BN140058]|uniref:TetR/AcrR family transcriptional regulator n=1 Tax=Sphingosinicella sp. BN140058 TaxID=1892855 RepID=UPI0013ED2DDF|nr:TetR/AcrR family transcriptional regulator [Sphingosinicella sp. BN140058]